MNSTEPIVTITRYTVSVLPVDDINHRYFALTVELTARGEWVVHDGHGAYSADGTWTQGRLGAHPFADYSDAIALAKRLAPAVTVNGRTATDAFRMAQQRQEHEL